MSVQKSCSKPPTVLSLWNNGGCSYLLGVPRVPQVIIHIKLGSEINCIFCLLDDCASVCLLVEPSCLIIPTEWNRVPHLPMFDESNSIKSNNFFVEITSNHKCSFSYMIFVNPIKSQFFWLNPMKSHFDSPDNKLFITFLKHPKHCLEANWGSDSGSTSWGAKIWVRQLELWTS